jgi:N utilization substance protein B
MLFEKGECGTLFARIDNIGLFMALPPQKFREIVFQLLYSQDFTAQDQQESIPFMMHELKVTRKSVAEALQMANQIAQKLIEIDAEIGACSTDYAFERISRVERTILRLGLYELLHRSDLPPKVAIAEAIRLCRKFGTPEGAQYVNAILDTVSKKKGILADAAAPLSDPPLPV